MKNSSRKVGFVFIEVHLQTVVHRPSVDSVCFLGKSSLFSGGAKKTCLFFTFFPVRRDLRGRKIFSCGTFKIPFVVCSRGCLYVCVFQSLTVSLMMLKWLTRLIKGCLS